MLKTKESSERKVVGKGNGIATASSVPFLLFPLLLLVFVSMTPAKLNLVEAFATPGRRSGIQLSSTVAWNGNFEPSFHLFSRSTRRPSTSFRLCATQTFQEKQQRGTSPEDDPNEEEGSNDEAKRLILDAERLRLEAEQMDANLTLQKIAVLEEKLSNNAWLEKQQGQTVKDLYEELRRLEMKISRPNSTVLYNNGSTPKSKESLSTESSSVTSSTLKKPPAKAEKYSSGSSRYSNERERNNKNLPLPPMAGFDDRDLDLYIPVCEDVTKMVPNSTLNERIKLFRDAPELQDHFKEKIQNLLLGPLKEMQELEELKEQYFNSRSSKEKDALLKQIKRLEAKQEQNNVNVNGGIASSASILISPEKLPPLTESELQERFETIKSLPDILVAVYLQRNGLYDLPDPYSTINVEIGSGGIGVNMDISDNSVTTDEEGKETDLEPEQIKTDIDDKVNKKLSDADTFDLYENLKLAIQLDYYDLQLQLLNQALAIRPMSEEVRKDYAKAFRSLPSPVRERYAKESIGIDTLDSTVIASDEESDVERVVEEIMKVIDDDLSPFSQAAGALMKLNGETGKGDRKRDQETAIVPPEYNDVEFIDRSRYLEEFFPSIALLEDQRPSPEDVDLFVNDCLTGRGTNKPFMVTSKPERVMGGYYIRGTNKLGFDESNNTTPNDGLVEEVRQRLQNHPTLKDKIDFFYILDPSPPSDEEMELEVLINSLFVITGKDYKALYGLSSPMTKVAVSISGLVSAFLFSLGSCVLNPEINASLEKALDNLSSQSSAGVTIDFQWFFDLCLPLYFSFLGILFVHELGHRIAASYYKFDIGLPNVLPSVTTGFAGSITPIKSPPPNNKALFDFSIAGPLAGLIVSLGLLLIGLDLTRQMGFADANLPVLSADLARTSSLGGGLIQYFLGKYALVPDQGAFVELHPFAISGWLGCTINALALLPLGHTDGGRVSLAMFGRRGAFVTKLFMTLILVISGLVGLDKMNILLAYALFVVVWQRELETPTRNEVDELDFSRGLLGITSAIAVGLILIPMTS